VAVVMHNDGAATAVRCSRISRESSRFHSREFGNEKVREWKH